MKKWSVEVSASMTYEFETDNPEAARNFAIDCFLSDAQYLDIDTEVREAE